jgi:RNA-directed DNA polymerase
MYDLSLLHALATSFLAGEPTVEQIVIRCRQTLGRSWKWLEPLARRYLRKFSGRTRPRRREVVNFLKLDRGFRRVWADHAQELAVQGWLTASPHMQPVAAAVGWDIPAIETPTALAEWFGITTGELQWFADIKNLGRKNNRPQLRHYHYRVLAKPSGSIRLIESPKVSLKHLQRQILKQILEKVPSHPAAHGFVKGRSIKTFVAPHVGQRLILRMDVQDFFPSFAAARIQAFFRTLGYPEVVAELLTGICITATPHEVWKTAGFDVDLGSLQDARIVYANPHLPQGAPTSPALANLCSFRIDSRLYGLAQAVGVRYSRYADDVAFSGDATFERSVERFSTHVASILLDEGFKVQFRKTRVMCTGVRQHLVGLVVNQRLNIMRSDFDRLKAILTNCVRYRPETQNRDSHPNVRLHLEGRVGFVEMINPTKGRRLRKIIDQIRWQ